MKAYGIGEQCYATFKDERLKEDPPAKKFQDPMKTKKLKTFSDMCEEEKKVKSNGRVIILKADRSLFGRITVMAQRHSLCMEDILSHPLGPLPWTVATEIRRPGCTGDEGVMTSQRESWYSSCSSPQAFICVGGLLSHSVAVLCKMQ